MSRLDPIAPLITGWRLDRLADPLRNGELLAVRACSPKPRSAGSFQGRYASVEPANCLVASITVTPVGKQ